MRLFQNSWFIVIILMLALFLRVFYLDRVPVSLFGDEVDVGYQAHSIAETGKDLKGNFLPFYIQSLYEYRAPLYIYSAVPFVKFLGLNEWGVRAPAVFWGIVSIFGIYLLCRRLFNNTVGVLGAFLLTISPWHLQYSRGSFEVTMLLSSFIFATYFFVLSFEKKNLILLAAFLFGLPFYIYSTSTILVPLILILLLFLYRKELLENKKYLLGAVVIFLITVFPYIQSIYQGEATSRFEGIGIFQDKILADKLNLADKSQNYTNPTVEKIFYNKVVIFLQVFFNNYFKTFSPEFLFTSGDPDFRHSIHEMGNLYYFELPFLILGLWFLINRHKKTSILVIGWLLVAPIPAALTGDGGTHSTRLFMMLPPLIILVSLGIYYLLTNLNKNSIKLLFGFILILSLFNIVFYFYRYYAHYPYESWRWWQSGFKESMLFMKSVEHNYQQLFFNETYEPATIRFLFWWQYPPQRFHQADLRKFDDIVLNFNGLSIDDRYYFGTVKKDIGVINFVKPGMLYMVSQQDEVGGDWDWEVSPPDNIKVLKTVRNPQNVPIFYIVTGK
jgi:4-amino-4-deoxy-L-arabinose transferase-like glycosyltransferase